MTSLTTLGYICDELGPDDFSDEIKNCIIKAFIDNISNEPTLVEPTKLAIKALPNSIPYAKKNFQVEAERNMIMEKIFVASSIQDEEIQENALQSLREVASNEYDSIQYYF